MFAFPPNTRFISQSFPCCLLVAKKGQLCQHKAETLQDHITGDRRPHTRTKTKQKLFGNYSSKLTTLCLSATLKHKNFEGAEMSKAAEDMGINFQRQCSLFVVSEHRTGHCCQISRPRCWSVWFIFLLFWPKALQNQHVPKGKLKNAVFLLAKQHWWSTPGWRRQAITSRNTDLAGRKHETKGQ